MTTRLLATTRLDMKNQIRANLYMIAAGVAVLVGLLLRFVFPNDSLPTLIPIFYLLAIGGTAYFFVAGMVTYEKDEHTMAAQIITPLRDTEYLISKVLSLLLVVLMESTIVLLLSYGPLGLNPFWLLCGVVLMSVGMTLGGFIQVVRYRSITDFLVPASAVAVILQLPFIHFMGIWESTIWYLLPTTAPTMIMKAAFQPVPLGDMVYGFGYSLLWITFLFWWARRAYYNHITMRGGM